MLLTEIQMDTDLDRVQKEIVEKEQAADDIMCGLNMQFTIFANKILPPDKQQSVPRQDTGESQGPVGARALMVTNFGNSAVFCGRL